MSIPITGLYASMMAALFVALSLRVIQYRRSRLISLGDNGDPDLLRRMRAQGNCAEYAPIGLVLLLLVEMSNATPLFVHGLGALLVAGRIAHALALSLSKPRMSLRVWGMLATFAQIILSGAWLLWMAIAPLQG